MTPNPYLCRLPLTVLSALLLSACASTAIDDNLAALGREGEATVGVAPQWQRDEDSRRAAAEDAAGLLAAPLSADGAVRLALRHAPAYQVLLSRSAAEAADIARAARPSSPVFAFERMVTDHHGERETEITRSLAFSLFDLLLWPVRQGIADQRQQALRLRAARELVSTALTARQAWIRAVAATERLEQAGRAQDAAEAAAELARRMQATGQYSRLQRARQQALAVEAAADAVRARREASAAREKLVRVLGLDAQQAARLQLPPHLPAPSAAPRPLADLDSEALAQRLDVRLARVELEAAGRAAGVDKVASLIDGLHLKLARSHETGAPTRRGYELEVPLPIFDLGDAERAGARARWLSAYHGHAATVVEALSQTRERAADRQAAWELARQARDSLVPLQQTVTDETVLRYNGMLVSVFDLLAEARAQALAVGRAIDATRDFWLAEAALDAALIGAPAEAPGFAGASSTPAARAADGH